MLLFIVLINKIKEDKFLHLKDKLIRKLNEDKIFKKRTLRFEFTRRLNTS